MDKKDKLRKIFKNELFVTSDGHNSIAGVESAIEIITDKYYLLEKKKVIKLNRFYDKRYECFCESGNCIAKSDNCKKGTLYFVEEK